MGELVARNDDLYGEGNYSGWSYKEEIQDGETSDPVKIKPTGRGTSSGSVIIICGAGTGKIQVSFDTYDEIDENTAEWIDWDKGEVTGTEVDVFNGPVTGIRCVSISEAITFKILI